MLSNQWLFILINLVPVAEVEGLHHSRVFCALHTAGFKINDWHAIEHLVIAETFSWESGPRTALL